MDNIIDELTYRSWKYQVEWYGLSFDKLRRIFTYAKQYEIKYLNERKDV